MYVDYKAKIHKFQLTAFVLTVPIELLVNKCAKSVNHRDKDVFYYASLVL